MSNPENKIVYSFGPALQLMSETYFMQEMHLSRLAFRRLCRMLKVPLVLMHSTALLNPLQFMIAMSAVTRVGQPNFALEPTNEDRWARGELDLTYLKSHLPQILLELAYSKDTLGKATVEEALQVAQDAADRLIEFGIHMAPSVAQAEYEEASLRHYARTYGEEFQVPLERFLEKKEQKCLTESKKQRKYLKAKSPMSQRNLQNTPYGQSPKVNESEHTNAEEI